MNDIRLVVCDLDGTLLNDKKRITERTASVMQKIQQMGIAVCLASGRDEQMMSVYDRKIGGCRYLLSNNGAMVRRNDNKILHCNYLAEDDTALLLSYLNEHKMTFMMYSDQEMYFSEGSGKLKKRISDYEKLSQDVGCPVKLNAKEFLRSAPVAGYTTAAKIVAYEDDEEKINAYKRYIDHMPGVHYEPTGYGLLGAFDRKVSKKAALLKIMEDMGAGSDAVCVFGDFENDLSMFECAEHRICMENGVEELKRAASHVTVSNNDDGVAVYLENILDILSK